MSAELVRVCQSCGSHVTDRLAFHWHLSSAPVPAVHQRVTCVVCSRAGCAACAKTWLLGICGQCPPGHERPVVALDDGNGHHDPSVDELVEAK